MVGQCGYEVIYRESSEPLLSKKKKKVKGKDNGLVKNLSSRNDLSQIRCLGFCIGKKKRKERKMRFLSVHSDKRNIKAGNLHHHTEVSMLF